MSYFNNKLNQKEQELNSIIDMIPGILYWKDNKGNYLKTNNSNLAGGMSASDLVGKNDLDIWPDKAEELKAHDLKVINTQKTSIQEEVTIENGIIKYYLAQKSPYLDHSNNTTGVIGLSIDITERKKLELEIRDKKNQLEKRLAFQKHYIKSYGYDYINALKLISDSIENIEARLMQLDIPQTVRSDLNDEFYQVNESLSEIYTLYQKINTAVLQQDERAKIVTIESTLEEIIENEVGLANTFISSDLKTEVTYQIKPLAQQQLLIDYDKLRHIIRTFLANFTNSVSAQNSHDINLTVTAKAGLRSNTLYVTFSFDGGTPFLEFEGDTIRAEHLLNHSLNHIPGSKHSLAYELALAKSYIELLCDGEELNDAIFDQQQLSFTLPFKKVYYKNKAPKLTAIINEVND
nr:PAS domain-containing protein [Cysteiniphilum sp. 19X3-34]